jgi:hypothetical protein
MPGEEKCQINRAWQFNYLCTNRTCLPIAMS